MKVKNEKLFELVSKAEYWLIENKTEAPEIDGKNILGHIRGKFYFEVHESQNNLHYPKEFWKNLCYRPEIKKKLENRTMLGSIGHQNRPVSDKDIINGKVSHIITALDIDSDNVVRYEALILGTPAGIALFGMLKAGSQLTPSIRALIEIKDCTKENLCHYIKTFSFETLDFARFPKMDYYL